MRLKMAVVTNQRHGFDGNPMTLGLFLVLTGVFFNLCSNWVSLDLDSV